jgi:hypothetical protein
MIVLPDTDGAAEESLLQVKLILVFLPLGKFVALLGPE